MSLAQALLHRAARSPDAPALESDDDAGAWTFADLADRTARAAKCVLDAAPRGAGPVALLMPGEAPFVAWFLGVGLAGRIVIPLNARLTATELTRQLDDARAALLLADPDDARLAKVRHQLPGVRVLEAPRLATLPPAQGPWPGESIAAGQTLAALFTSGTSGRAKGACLSWANFEASAAAARERLGEVVERRWLCCMPLFHVGALSIVARSLLYGGPVRLHHRFDAVAVRRALDAGDVAGVSLVPTMLARLLEQDRGRRAPAGVEAVLLGGAAAAPSLLARALEAGYPVCPTYGLTEAASQVATAAPPPRGRRSPLPMRPLAGVEVRIVVNGGEAATGEPGEILVRGPTVMGGYLHDPESTARALRDGWLHTGDLGCLDPEGGLRVLDRRDDLVVSGGENVYPAEVEAVLLEHPQVAEAGVTGLPDDDLGTRVSAWVVARGRQRPTTRELDEFCRARLAGFKCPREYRFVEELPRTAAGKLLRRRLPDAQATD